MAGVLVAVHRVLPGGHWTGNTFTNDDLHK